MQSGTSPIHPAGWPFVVLFAAVSVAIGILWLPLGLLGAVLTLWCLWFFRDPNRTVPVGGDTIVAPADGVVEQIVRAPPPPEIASSDAPRQRVSIFMNVFNVHVNRIPVAGRIAALAYRPGRFINASLDKASELNERQSVRLVTQAGLEFVVVQIAGLIARRIKCDLHEDQAVATGERFGIIRFGSRVDLYLPDGIEPLVAVGQKTVAGETVLARTAAAPAAADEGAP